MNQNHACMKFITKQLKKRFAQVGEQEGEKDPLVIAKFFNPCGATNWYAIAYYPDRNICFGYVEALLPEPHNDEWGHFSIDELEAVTVPPFGLHLERDLHFKECRFSELNVRQR